MIVKMSSGKSYDSHKERYQRVKIVYPGMCQAKVPFYDNYVPNDGDHSHYSGQEGDCHIVGRQNFTIGQKSDNAPRSTSPLFSCEICKKGANIPTTSQCGHIFCGDCIDKKLKEKSCCPVCKSSFENKIRLKTNKNCVTFEDNAEDKCKEPKKNFLKLGLNKSVGYLNKKAIKLSGTLMDIGHFAKNKTYATVTTSEFQFVLFLGTLLILLIVFGVLPKIRVGAFIVDLFNFIKDYPFIEKSEEPIVAEYTTITENTLPCTVGCIMGCGSKCGSEGSIFKTFLDFFGLA